MEVGGGGALRVFMKTGPCLPESAMDPGAQLAEPLCWAEALGHHGGPTIPGGSRHSPGLGHLSFSIPVRVGGPGATHSGVQSRVTAGPSTRFLFGNQSGQ